MVARLRVTASEGRGRREERGGCGNLMAYCAQTEVPGPVNLCLPDDLLCASGGKVYWAYNANLSPRDVGEKVGSLV